VKYATKIQKEIQKSFTLGDTKMTLTINNKSIAATAAGATAAATATAAAAT
jgi:hypothetical protein